MKPINPETFEQHDKSMGHRKGDDAEARKKALVNRMARAIGHMEAVRRMMENDSDPSQILIQLAAVRSAIGGISRIYLQEHIEDKIWEAVDHPDDETSMEDLKKVISYFIK